MASVGPQRRKEKIPGWNLIALNEILKVRQNTYPKHFAGSALCSNTTAFGFTVPNAMVQTPGGADT